ncbi:hypothetical protein BC629DRAFT_1741464 [Irpex lacteus]|nr:hypothetical protein BC629DRAFT_1741464 [Irpex lacteus]
MPTAQCPTVTATFVNRGTTLSTTTFLPYEDLLVYPKDSDSTTIRCVVATTGHRASTSPTTFTYTLARRRLASILETLSIHLPLALSGKHLQNSLSRLCRHQNWQEGMGVRPHRGQRRKVLVEANRTLSRSRSLVPGVILCHSMHSSRRRPRPPLARPLVDFLAPSFFSVLALSFRALPDNNRVDAVSSLLSDRGPFMHPRYANALNTQNLCVHRHSLNPSSLAVERSLTPSPTPMRAPAKVQ